MFYSLIFKDEALKEFAEAFAWYEEQQNGLGLSFRKKTYQKLENICNNPLHYKRSYNQFHEAIVDKFPFVIVYLIDERLQSITVFAVFHTSRNPKKKFKRK